MKHRVITDKGCWELNLLPTNYGYSEIQIGTERYRAHRISAAYYHGMNLTDKDQQALHKNECNNKRCWNPEHIYVGNASQNKKDYFELKGNLERTKKRFCKNGHEFTPENTKLKYKNRNKYRVCLACYKNAILKAEQKRLEKKGK